MRIGLNLLHAHPSIGGAWNYIDRFVKALAKHDSHNEYICFVSRESINIVPNIDNFNTVHIDFNPAMRTYRIFIENSLLQKYSYQYNLDVLHWFGNTIALFNTCPSIVSVHDLLVYDNPHAFSGFKRYYLKVMIAYTVKHAKYLLPISKYTAINITNRFSIASDRMVIAPAIVSDIFKPMPEYLSDDFRQKYGLPITFWLYVAHFYPHKNHIRLLKAYHVLKKNNCNPWPLVLRGDFKNESREILCTIRELDLINDVHFLPRISENDLSLLYSAATGLVFPSTYEGGGIPVLEAMACGCPVISSNIPSIHEFAGDAVQYFDQNDIASIAHCMNKFQTDTDFQMRLSNMGIQKAIQHRAEAIIPNVINVYNKF